MTIKKPDNAVIGKAIKLLDTSGNEIVEVKGGKRVIQSKYNSYIASFGGSIINSGLIATLMIFEANAEKKKIIEKLVSLYNETNTERQLQETDNYYFKTIRQKTPTEIMAIQRRLIDIAVALKLAMRCYEQVDNIND